MHIHTLAHIHVHTHTHTHLHPPPSPTLPPVRLTLHIDIHIERERTRGRGGGGGRKSRKTDRRTERRRYPRLCILNAQSCRACAHGMRLTALKCRVCVCVYVCVCVCPLQVTHRDMVPHHDHDSRAKVLCALVCVLVSWYVCLYEITDRRFDTSVLYLDVSVYRLD